MLKFDPAKRLTAREVLLHSWLTGDTKDSGISANVLDLMRSYNAERRLRKIIITVQAAIRFKNRKMGLTSTMTSKDSLVGLSALSIESGSHLMSSGSNSLSTKKGGETTRSSMANRKSILISADASMAGSASEQGSKIPRAKSFIKANSRQDIQTPAGPNRPPKIVNHGTHPEKELGASMSKSPMVAKQSSISSKIKSNPKSTKEPALPEKSSAVFKAKPNSSTSTLLESEPPRMKKEKSMNAEQPTVVKAPSNRTRNTRKSIDMGFKIGELK